MERLSLYTLLTLFVASACATGESLGDVGSDVLSDGGTVDASIHGETGGATGSGGAAPLGSGGVTELGGAENAGAGSVVSGGGGSGAVSTGTGGATNTGGAKSTGGTKSTGGATSKGGALGVDAGGDAGPACFGGQKECASDHLCWPPSAAHGCDLGSACTPCPAAPTNGYAKCTANACDFDCLGGFTKSGGQCIGGAGGAGGGGAGGGTGTGGGPPACVPKDCGGCQAFVSSGCCKGDGTCGCALIWVPGSACK